MHNSIQDEVSVVRFSRLSRVLSILSLPKNLSVPIIIVQFLVFHVKAQDSSSIMRPLHPNLAVVFAILSILLSVTFLALAYAKFCRPSVRNSDPDQDFDEFVQSRSSRFSGVDKTVIESLPFFRFSSLKGSKEGLECAVCLSKFEETDSLRLLPKCRHAFHISCIDQWLESHSSCPLCRYKIDVKDLRRSFSHSNSTRFLQSSSNLSEDRSIELFVERDQDHSGSSRFKTESGSPNIDQTRNEEKLLIQEFQSSDGDGKILHRFKHKILVSDVKIKNRWSEVNTADLLLLNSQMLGIKSHNRFAHLKSYSLPTDKALFSNEDMDKIKEDFERKRLFESRISRIDGNLSVSTSGSSKLNPAEKRSMSEITNLSRFRQFSLRNKTKDTDTGANVGREERIRRLWMPIAQQTIQWFAGREKILQESRTENQTLDV